MNEELVQSAKINFENLEKAFPIIKTHPMYTIAKKQLDMAVEEVAEEDDGKGGDYPANDGSQI